MCAYGSPAKGELGRGSLWFCFKAQEPDPTPTLPLKKGEGASASLDVSLTGWELCIRVSPGKGSRRVGEEDAPLAAPYAQVQESIDDRTSSPAAGSLLEPR